LEIYVEIRLYVFALALVVLALPVCAQQNPGGLALPGTAVVKDAACPLLPSQVKPGGLLGERFAVSEKNRLLTIDEDEMLDGFRHRPGRHAWIGEHVGKWLHAACLTYECTGNKALKTKIDRVASELMKTQEADGYLGTYSPDKRFGFYPNADWDVWSHKYCLIGLLSYYQCTGNKDALETCKRVGDLLIRVFGPGKANIVASGWHYGLAPTSVLEPIVLLYRATGDKRYLDFAEHTVKMWDVGEVPQLLSGLLRGQPVSVAGGGKAYEQTSCLAGLCELYRVTGKREYLTAVLKAWDDITRNRLYITGSGSFEEVWSKDNQFPNGVVERPCETCVTVTWLQLNMQLLRLLGEPRFAEEIDRTLYNSLLASQKPTGDDWCGYTVLEGEKGYYSNTTCCHSSGPRGVALAPEFLYTATQDGITANIFSASRATVPFSGGKVELRQITQYPLGGSVRIAVNPVGVSDPFAIGLRVPKWSPKVSLAVNGELLPADPDTSGYVSISRQWQRGDVITYTMDMAPRIVLGDHGNDGKMSVMYGPLVLAADMSQNPKGATIANIGAAVDNPAKFKLRRARGGESVFTTDGLMQTEDGKATRLKLSLTPYYAAGASGSQFVIWMKRPASVVSR
jgi:uncharacterized protein